MDRDLPGCLMIDLGWPSLQHWSSPDVLRPSSGLDEFAPSEIADFGVSIAGCADRQHSRILCTGYGLLVTTATLLVMRTSTPDNYNGSFLSFLFPACLSVWNVG
ncbi:unnamed protein product [Calypogeia fissa]